MSVELLHTIAEIRGRVAEARRRGCTVGFVPTMGALHAAHGALIERAREETDLVVVSVFVNPIQFDLSEDLDQYPRTLPADVELCAAHGADVVFAPDAGEMYPSPQLTFIEVASLSERLCGEFRPGHFRGVATVVGKLFNIVHPDRAYFGEKDAQQLAVVRRMVADLDSPVVIVPVATVREPDGLAMSLATGASTRKSVVSPPRCIGLYRPRSGASRTARRVRRRSGARPSRYCNRSPPSVSSTWKWWTRSGCSRSSGWLVRCAWPRRCGSALPG